MLEIGPGMGVLTKYLFADERLDTFAIEIDHESYEYLLEKYPLHRDKIINADFLDVDLSQYFKEPFVVIGNFPYNISSQIVFKILEHRNQIPEMVGMFQKEVAERFVAKPRTKAYGILSVLVQAFYKIEYLFTVSEHVFSPPPKVKSAVIRLTRNQQVNLDCDEKLFFKVVKQSFNHRRKTLKNALIELFPEINSTYPFMTKRAEELDVPDFVELTRFIQKQVQ